MDLERVFIASWTLQELRTAPLGPYLERFCNYLLNQGFSKTVARSHLGRLIHLNHWLAEDGWNGTPCLSRNDIERFGAIYASRCRCRGMREAHLKRMRHSLNRFVAFLRLSDEFDSQDEKPIYQPLLDGYLRWMRAYRHAAPGTLDLRRRGVARFLATLGEAATPQGLNQMDAHGIERFFADSVNALSRASRRSLQAALRTFLRYSFHEGYIRQRLDRAVPTLRTYKLDRVPRGLTEAQAQAVLGSVDRTTHAGRRDYAMLTMLHAYGVRGGQLRALRLEDIQWTQNRIWFKAIKGGKDSLLPLTAEVGGALLDYLRHARPPSRCGEVFLTTRAPYRPLPRSSALSTRVHTHIQAAGLRLPSQGSHTFRHGLATRLVAQGHSLKAVADVLGHRHVSTTFIYTKVDYPALSQVALEWPGEVYS